MAGYDFKSARNILSDPFSCYKHLTSVRNMCLPPRHLGSVCHGIRDQLDAEVNFYCPDLESVVVGYDNIKLLQSLGSIMDDSPFLHFRMQADYIVFKPTRGSILKGIVNKVSKDHVGCLVHSRFNASIHRPHHNLNGWRGSKLAQGEEFPFQVQDIYSNNAVISLTGKLVDEKTIKQYLNSLDAKESSESQSVIASTTGNDEHEEMAFVDSENGEITLENEPVAMKHRKKRAKQISKSNNAISDLVEEMSGNVDVSNSTNHCKLKSKKSKKRSHECISRSLKSAEKESETVSLSPIHGKKRRIGSDSILKNDYSISSLKNVRFDSSVVDSPVGSAKKRRKSHVENSDFGGSFLDDSLLNNEFFDETLDSSLTSGIDISIHDDSVLGDGKLSKRKKKSKKKSKLDESVESTVTKLKPKPCELDMELSVETCHREKKNKRRRISQDGSVDINCYTTDDFSETKSSKKMMKNASKQKKLMEVVLALQGEVTRTAAKLMASSPSSKKPKRKKKRRRSDSSEESNEAVEMRSTSCKHLSVDRCARVGGSVGTGCELGDAGGASRAFVEKKKRHSDGDCWNMTETHSRKKKKKMKKRESL